MNIYQELNNRNLSFSKLCIDELDDMLELYRERIKWFKDNKIKQWGRYLERHPRKEFSDIIKKEIIMY